MDLDTLSLDEIWQEIEQEANQHPEFIEGLEATYSIQLKADEKLRYGLTFKNGETKVVSGGIEDPDCSLSMDVDHFKKLLQGNLNTTTAFMTGKLKVKGNIGLALKLENILKKFSF